MARSGSTGLKDDVAKRGQKKGDGPRGDRPKGGKQKKDKKKNKQKKDRPRPSPRFTAATADRYDLYQLAVNSPEEDVEFLRKAYRRIRGAAPRHLREDFCGTALLCSEWVRSDSEATAEGFDNDSEPLAWGTSKNLAPLGDAAQRAVLHCQDVRAPSQRPPDVRCAHNFSWCCFHTREELVEYFRAVRDDLAQDGVFSLDIHGGPESMEEMEEIREIEEGFDYVWDQDAYWPGTGEYLAYIHFRFQDGSELRKAFTYRWRLWFLTEVTDALRDAGFARVESWWEGTDEDGEGEDGDGVFEPDERGENCLSWITYVLAVK